MMRSAPDGTLIPTYGGQRPAYSDYLTGADGDPITRDMVACRSDPFGQTQIQSRFTTTEYPCTKEKIAPRGGTNSLWNKEIKDILSRLLLSKGYRPQLRR